MSDYPSLYLDGKTEIAIGTTTEFGLVDKSFSVEVWVKIESHVTTNKWKDATILGSSVESTTGRNHLHIVIRDKKPYFGFYHDDTGAKTVLQEKVWYHLAFCYDRAGKEQRIYVNGVLDSTQTNKESFLGVGDLKISNRFFIWEAGENAHFHGHIRDLRIWDSALSQQRIAENMYRDLISAEGLTAVWKFNDASIVKSVSQPNKGTFQEQIYASSPQQSFEKRSSVVSFRNDEGIIRLSEEAKITIAKSATVEAWLNPSDDANSEITDSPIVVAFGESLKFQLLCNLQKVEFILEGGENQTDNYFKKIVNLNYAFASNQWYHVAGYFDMGKSEIGVLINGVAKATQRLDPGDYSFGQVKELIIGGSPSYQESRFNGKVAEVRLWGIARSTDAIQSTMYQELEAQRNLKAYWKLDETYGQVARDGSGKGNEAILEDVVRVESSVPVTNRRSFNPDDLLSGIKNAWRKVHQKEERTTAEIRKMDRLELELADLTVEKIKLEAALSQLNQTLKEKETEFTTQQGNLARLSAENEALKDDSGEISIANFIKETKDAITLARTETADSAYHLGNVNLQFKVIPTGTGGLISFPKPTDLLGGSGQLSTIELEFEPKQEVQEKVAKTNLVPDVADMTEIMARRKLTQAGFVVEVKYQATGNHIQANRVVNQYPHSSENVELGTKVAIYLGKEIK